MAVRNAIVGTETLFVAKDVDLGDLVITGIERIEFVY